MSMKVQTSILIFFLFHVSITWAEESNLVPDAIRTCIANGDVVCIEEYIELHDGKLGKQELSQLIVYCCKHFPAQRGIERGEIVAELLYLYFNPGDGNLPSLSDRVNLLKNAECHLYIDKAKHTEEEIEQSQDAIARAILKTIGELSVVARMDVREPVLNVSVPGEGYPPGISPAAVRDPTQQKEYVKAIEENRIVAEEYMKHRQLIDPFSSIVRTAESMLVPFYVDDYEHFSNLIFECMDNETAVDVLDRIQKGFRRYHQIFRPNPLKVTR